MASVWIDERGSEVLQRSECLRLLAMEARGLGVARIAVSTDGAPIVIPVNYAYHEGGLLVRLGPGLLGQLVPGSLVAVEVDHVDVTARRAWSVLVRGLATKVDPADLGRFGSHLPHPLAPEPGHLYVHVRADVATGRRFALTHTPPLPDAAPAGAEPDGLPAP